MSIKLRSRPGWTHPTLSHSQLQGGAAHSTTLWRKREQRTHCSACTKMKTVMAACTSASSYWKEERVLGQHPCHLWAEDTAQLQKIPSLDGVELRVYPTDDRAGECLAGLDSCSAQTEDRMWTVAGRLKWRLRERCRGEVGCESLRKSQGIRGGSVATPPHPQSRMGTYASTLIPQEGQSPRKVLIVGRRDPVTKGKGCSWQRETRGLHLRTQE
ncbi:hypothetical protein VULLAG_LOCUS5794 [Vulpes lagopus]